MRRDGSVFPTGQRPAVDPAVAVAARLIHGDLDLPPCPTFDALQQVGDGASNAVLEQAVAAWYRLLDDLRRQLSALANPTPEEARDG